ncbi:MAG: hypothetical protein U0T81_03820 [Saprospiraceae bacterium]
MSLPCSSSGSFSPGLSCRIRAMYGYTPNQDQIMTAPNQNLNEEGTYMLPNVPPGTSHEQAQKDMEANKGKPLAMISYQSFDTSYGCA